MSHSQYHRNKITGERETLLYAPNSKGNMRFHVGTKALADRVYDANYFLSRHEDVAKDNLLQTVIGKKIVFVEYDEHLPDYGPAQVAQLFDKHGIAYTICSALYDEPDYGVSKAMQAITENDVIIFQSQFVRNISFQLMEAVFAMTEKKVFIEAYISEPRFYYQPKVVHDVYVLNVHDEFASESEEWEFYRLSKNPYWKYKNRFDK